MPNVPDPFPMPRIDEMLDRIGCAKYISTVDLTKGYWQVPLAVDSQKKTAFVTPLGKYQFTTMPFGLAGVPSVFQHLMNSILADIPQYAAAYIDDVTIYSNSWEEHLSHLREVFLRLKARGLTIKAGKCQFGRKEVSFLGHRVGRGRIRPSLAKIQDVANFTRPTPKKQIRAFLGLAGYYRKFIENFSHLTTPLSDLTKKDAPDKIVWNEDLEAIFKTVKKMLTSLATPDDSKEYILQTDASGRGIGATLSQWGRLTYSILLKETSSTTDTVQWGGDGMFSSRRGHQAF